jgi:outer membrane protein assembly factor BamB
MFFRRAAKRAAYPLAAGVVAVVVLAIGVSGGVARATTPSPGWPQLHYGADRTGYQPNETRIGTGNVGQLTQARTYRAAANPSAPLIANGILYVDTGTLYAFDATGAANCSAAPVACTPLWTAPTAYFHGMTIANGDVYVTDGEGVQAFAAAGSKNCSGTPKVCTPLWATSTHTSTGPAFTPGSGWPVFASGVLYVPGYGDGLPLSTGGAYVAAFDAAGSAGCSGSPTVCVPMWTTTGLPGSTANTGSPAIGANGVLYIANQTLYAFDAAGSASCSGTPKVCAPLWTAATANSPTYSAPAVANGTVYVGSWNAKLYAFDAAGSANCSAGATGKTCTPLWTAATPGSIGGTPAVANRVVYTVSGNGTLSAFDAAGSTDCSGTATAKTCTPLWHSAAGTSGYVTSSSPAVANGVVYFSSTNGGTYGYDAAGSLDCSGSGTARTCAPLWGAVTGFIGGGSPAVVNGVLYINVSGNGTIYAYSLAA